MVIVSKKHLRSFGLCAGPQVRFESRIYRLQRIETASEYNRTIISLRLWTDQSDVPEFFLCIVHSPCLDKQTESVVWPFTPKVGFCRAKPSGARYCQGKLSVSVRLYVTLKYRDRRGWNSAKIISRLISLTFSLSANPQHDGSIPKGTPQILAGIGVG